MIVVNACRSGIIKRRWLWRHCKLPEGDEPGLSECKKAKVPVPWASLFDVPLIVLLLTVIFI